MDNQIPDNDKSSEITAEHAVLIPTIPSIKSIMAYVEAVAVVIGSCHIHSVYEDQENIKIYLNDKRFVDILVNNGVSILGRRMNVDYAVPRADKVILSNVDPIIPDAVLMKLLCFYGSPVSAIIHEKITTNSEYSHIECGKRKVYMKIFDDKKVPTKINFTYQDVCYQIDVLVEQCEGNGIYEASIERSDDEGNDELFEIESNISLKPNINELGPAKQPTPRQIAYRNRGKKNTQYSAAFAAKQIKRRARKGWYSSRKVKRIGGNNKANKPKKTRPKRDFAKSGDTSTKVLRKGPRDVNKAKRGRNSAQSVPVQENEVEITNESGAINSNSLDQSPLPNGTFTEHIDSNSISPFPLSFEELENFIQKTRFHREPVQIAMEFLADNKSPDVLHSLKSQLLEYHNVCKDQPLKLRIKRLILSLKNAKPIEVAE